MANFCGSCDDLRTNAPNVLVNGIDETACTSLKNDTGLNPATQTNDCDDLEDLNDCLVGMMENEIEAYDVCDWKEYMKKFVPNVYTVSAAIICAICGLWTRVHNLCEQIKRSSYVGIMTLYTTSGNVEATGTGAGVQTQVLAFDHNSVTGNAPSGVFAVTSDYKGIRVNNVSDVPLLVDATYNCSKRTNQRVASCYLTIKKDDMAIGQTPFITPTTYDQQVAAEPFILQPGQTATLRYYFGVGQANSWYYDTFGRYNTDTVYVHAKHEPRVASDPENQRSYFSVKVTSILPEANC